MSGIFNSLKEQARQASCTKAGLADDLFYQSNTYFFELLLPDPSGKGGTVSYLFPMVLNPDSYQLSEPFSVEPTYTQGAGLFVEETGIISRTIRLRGTTAFAPKPANFAVPYLSSPTYKTSSHSRSLPAPPPATQLSGQRHFHYLQDAVFRTYADYKRDSSTAPQTAMVWHNPHDEEHWLVAPRAFNLERSAAQPVHYNYDIELLVLDKAASATLRTSEDQGVFDKIKNVIRTASQAVGLISGCIQDLTAAANVVKQAINDVAKLIDNVTRIFTATQNFIAGVVGVIQAPLALVSSTRTLVEQALATFAAFDAAGKAYTPIGPALTQSMRSLIDGFDLLMLYPQAFQLPAAANMQNIRLIQQQQAALSAAPGATAVPQTSGVALAQPVTGGTTGSTATTAMAPASFKPSTAPQSLPGDAARAASISTIGQAVIPYTGATQYIVQRGDSLANLAARFLGDARLWQYLAQANGLKPPFYDIAANQNLANAGDDDPVGQVLGVGRTILIPNYSTPPAADPDLPILGVTNDQSPQAHFLGTDLALDQQGASVPTPYSGCSRDSLDLLVRTDTGACDVQVVEGVANLSQALVARLSVDQGADVLYQNVGVAPIVSISDAGVNAQTARFRVQTAIAADPRVVSVTGVQLLPGTSADAVQVTASVVLKGQSAPTAVQIGLSQT